MLISNGRMPVTAGDHRWSGIGHANDQIRALTQIDQLTQGNDVIRAQILTKIAQLTLWQRRDQSPNPMPKARAYYH